MPFPLLSLPYGFRRRLVELSTPFEAYSIQVAAPHVIPFCQPVKLTTQNDYSTNFLQFDGQNNQFCDEKDNPVTLGEHELRTLRLGLDALNLFKMDRIVNHLILSQSAALYFTSCHIDLAFVKKLRSNLNAKLSKKPERFSSRLNLLNCTYDSSTTISAICDSLLNHFSQIKWLPFPALPQGLNCLVTAKITELFRLEIELTSFNMLDISPDALLKFFLMQDERFQFYIHLRINKSDAEIQEKVDAMLSKNFKPSPYIHIPWHLRDPKPQLIRYLHISYSNKSQRYEFIKKE